MKPSSAIPHNKNMHARKGSMIMVLSCIIHTFRIVSVYKLKGLFY